MKHIALSVLVFFSCLAIAAAQDVFNFPLAANRRPEVIAITARMAAHRIVTASFTQAKRITSLKKSLVSRGRMIFNADRGLVWQTKSPFPGTLLMTQDALKQKTASGRVSTLPAGNSDTFRRFAATMQAVLRGDFAAIENDFAVFFARPTPAAWVIGLKPRDKTLASVIDSLEIRGAADLDGFTLREPNGDSIVYSFTGVAYPAALSQADEKEFF